MTFYNINQEMGFVLNDILNKISNNKKDYLLKNIAITWINYNNENLKGNGCGINQKENIYPASIVKLVYALAIHAWIEKKILTLNSHLVDAITKMLELSSNDATSYIVDLLTGTTSGPSLEGNCWEDWKYQRYIINDWLKDLKWDEISEFNCCQKTWEDSPYGREKDFYGTNNQNRNSMSTDGTARIMEEIMQNLKYNNENINIKNLLLRNFDKNSILQDENDQIKGFLGEGLPEKTPFWSKAGYMSQVKHDAAYWMNNENSRTLLVVFGNGEEFTKDNSFLPEISKAIYHFNQK